MPNFQSLFDSVCDRARKAIQIHTAADALEWDERTGLPREAGEYRAGQIASMRSIVHQIRTDKSYGDDLTALMGQAADEDPHGEVGATIRCLYRDWDRDRKLPNELVERTANATVRGQQTWDEARRADNFAQFRDALKEILDLKREAGQRLSEGTDQSAYEALLDEYEPDARVETLQQVFDAIRHPLVELIERTKASATQPDLKSIEGVFTVEDQRSFSHRVAEAIGFDFDRGRLDETSHPFCTTLGPHDCRILTRYDPHLLAPGLFGTMHEAGHGMYEQGLRAEWFGLAPGSYVSLGIHESQSRLWENQVGRSLPFWQWLFRETQQTFTPQLDEVSLETFHFAINAVRPSLIRVEADEATYNLHILIRFDLERQLIDGSLSVDDLPEAWNARYESDLGIRPPSDADGVLQDVHWSAGLFGYFPTYTLGNLAAAQLYAKASEKLGDIDELHARGEFRPLLDWLRQNVHFHGRCYSGNELVEQACGTPLSAEPLISYLTTKLSKLYELSN